MVEVPSLFGMDEDDEMALNICEMTLQANPIQSFDDPFPWDISMTPEEFDTWKKWTRESGHRWIVDPIHDGRGGRDLLLFIGGESGKLLCFSNWDTLEIGSYEGAVPHIGEAIFQIEERKTFESHVLAVVSGMEIAGQAFIVALSAASHDREED